MSCGVPQGSILGPGFFGYIFISSGSPWYCLYPAFWLLQKLSILLFVRKQTCGCHLTHINHPNNIADQVHSPIAVWPQQDNAPCHTAKTFQERPDEREKKLKASTWLPNSPHPLTINHLWNLGLDLVPVHWRCML